MTATRRRFLAGIAAASLAGCAAPVTRGRGLQTMPDALFRGGLRRHGFQAVAVAGEVRREWRLPGVNTGEHTAAKASPVPVPDGGGDIVVPGDNGLVYRVSRDGDVRWRGTTHPSTRGIHGTPAIANDTVYVGAYDGAMYAFDLHTGAREWRTRLGDAIGSSPAYHDGTVYIAVEFADPSGSVAAVDAATGDVEWEDHRPTDHPHSTIAIDLDAGRLVVGSNDGRLYAWEYPALEFAWSFETGGEIKGPVATHDGAAFFGSWDHHVYRVDLETGAEDWSFEAGDLVMTGPGIDVAEGVVYMGSHDTRLYALDVASGDPRWSFDTGGLLIGCPTVTEESVIVGSYDRNLYAVSKDGEQRWRHEGTGWATSTPLVHDGGIHYTDRATDERTGALYRIEPADQGRAG